MNKNAVEAGVAVEPVEKGEQFRFGRVGGEHMRFGMKAEPPARAFLHADIDLRGGVFADAHEGEAGLESAGFETRKAPGGFRVELLRDEATVNEVRHPHHCSTGWRVSTLMTGVLGQRSSSNSSPVMRMR